MKKKSKNKNRGRKSLTAVGAVVAAGLTPGIVTGSPTPQLPPPDVEITAADMIAINGETFEFDELFAMQQINRDIEQHKKMYGPPSVMDDAARREQARLDSIRRAREQEMAVCVYGPPPPRWEHKAEVLREVASTSKDDAINLVKRDLFTIVSELTPVRYEDIWIDSDFVRDLKMSPQNLEELIRQVGLYFDVQITEDMLKQLKNMSSLSRFIVEVATPIDK